MKKAILLAVLPLLFSLLSLAANVPLISVSPTATTYTDTLGSTFDGQTMVYWVTTTSQPCPAQPTCGESGPTNFTQAVIPPTGTHSVVLTWVPDTGTLGQNIYRAQLPAAPTNLTNTVN
jgi:hypothetical protein